jgi:hypothetical protein
MTSKTAVVAAVIVVLLGGSVSAADRTVESMSVLGSVQNVALPVDKALVLALNLSSYEILQTWTDESGHFALAALPVGIYRIIAVKRGFAPAIATIVPNRTNHSLLLRLRPEATATSAERDAIWAVRRAIPSDILRELQFDHPVPAEEERVDRLSGRVTSTTGFDGNDAGFRYARTSLGMTHRLGEDWVLSFDGQLRLVGEGQMQSSFAEASGMSMTVRSSEDQIYRISSSRSRWLDGTSHEGAATEVAFEAHEIAWSGVDSTLELRYHNSDNLFGPFGGSEAIELRGEKALYDSGSSTMTVALRLGQHTSSRWDGPRTDSLRTAEISADASHRVRQNLRVGYGLGSRHSELGSEWLPHAGAQWTLPTGQTLVFSGTYKVYQESRELFDLPAVIFVNEAASTYPRYRYSVGVSTGGDENPRFSATASISEIDSLVRVIFEDRFDQFWDGLYLEAGDTHHDLTLRWNRILADKIALHFTSSAGWAATRRHDDPRKTYVTGSLQSLYRPSGTSVDVAYRYIEQSRFESEVAETERLALRMGQTVRLPLSVQVLLGVDLGRDSNPAFVRGDDPSLQTRLVGGVSVVF